MLHQGLQTREVRGGPVSSFCLSAFLDNVPRIVPPAAVVVGPFRLQHVRSSHRILCIGMHCAEYEQASANGDLVIEHLLLRVWIAGKNQNWTNVELSLIHISEPTRQAEI